MEALKRQLIEVVAALDVHDAATGRIPLETVRGRAFWDGREATREALVLAVAGVSRSIVAYWKAEEASAGPCGAEFAGHVCSTKGAHVMHEDERTRQRWPVVP
jgi:hypothetical protein